MEKGELLGFSSLFIGIVLLIFTFFSAYAFLREELSLVGSSDLIRTFGETLAPLMKAAIHAIYLGIMVWIGSIITLRAIQIITGLSKEGGRKRKEEGKEEAKAEQKA
ncbi:hypothetical protein KEJ36_05290 [Candidatus Bathyarchaeota archaeon]|nr:hypothetical protein [Candidatus Bathyarchaeota archaeon]MBS7628198.1 hypothetical protein [Candidatus Bathyarchaeota archaeon]